MSLSGIVITLHEDPRLAEAAVARLGGDSRVTLGPRKGTRAAAVLETPSLLEDEAAFEALLETEGVAHVDLVCVYDVEELELAAAGDPCAATAPPDVLARALAPDDGAPAQLVTLSTVSRSPR